MNEEEIAAALRSNIPSEYPYEPQIIEETIDTTNGQATTAIDFRFDELIRYKMNDYFGDRYKPNDEVAKQQSEYIYKAVSELIGDTDYGFVIAKIRDLERIIGTAHTENRRYRLYQWLKLDHMRRSIDAQMGALSDG